MSEPQLERSVLEAKERDELYAIAEALGTKPASRTKKGDLITQILRATGVQQETAEPVEKPRRTRARKAAAAPANGATADAAAPAPPASQGTEASPAKETSAAGPEADAEQLSLGDAR